MFQINKFLSKNEKLSINNNYQASKMKQKKKVYKYKNVNNFNTKYFFRK